MQPLVQRLGYIALNVVNLDAAVRDALDVAGLSVVERTGLGAMLTSNTRHAELVLHQASSDTVRCIGLETIGCDEVDEAERRIRAAGLRILGDKPSLPTIERAVTFATSEGHVFEVHSPMAKDRPRRYTGAGIHPRYLDHVNLSAEDPERTARELNRALGLLMTERTTGYELVWLRASDGRHHTVGCVKGRSGLHHYSWEFAEFADFKRLGDVLDSLDRVIVWGPGRHGCGDNIFAYYVDSAGFMVECTCEMEVINDPHFQPRVVEPGENLSNYKAVNRWGALPSQQWISHHSDFAASSDRPTTT
jgi:catechol 2,3-dioxygenase-like lactoylglutathione lyase family enzyme